MARPNRLATRAFGAEPGVPEVAELSPWIAKHRGITADITTYRLYQSLAPQLEAGINLPCGGGKFYAARIRESLAGVETGRATGELDVLTETLMEDAAGIAVQKRGIWCALPAPHVLALRDAYYYDDEEWNHALCQAYRMLMRAMRDAGISGHVLIGESGEGTEIAALAWQKTFFFLPEPDRGSLENLLEHQQQLAVPPHMLATVFDLTNEYDVRQIIIMDADAEAVDRALSFFDPDQLRVGGYCTAGGGEYWKKIVDAAGYTAR